MIRSTTTRGNTARQPGNPALAVAYTGDVEALAASGAEGSSNTGLSALRQVAETLRGGESRKGGKDGESEELHGDGGEC